MHVFGVAGAAGTTATVVNLTAALRRAGYHGAVLDFTGEAAATFRVETDATLAAALVGDASPGETSGTVGLPHGDVTNALSDYAAGLGRDPPRCAEAPWRCPPGTRAGRTPHCRRR